MTATGGQASYIKRFSSSGSDGVRRLKLVWQCLALCEACRNRLSGKSRWAEPRIPHSRPLDVYGDRYGSGEMREQSRPQLKIAVSPAVIGFRCMAAPFAQDGRIMFNDGMDAPRPEFDPTDRHAEPPVVMRCDTQQRRHAQMRA